MRIVGCRLVPIVLLALACGSAAAQIALAPNQQAPPLEGFTHPKHEPTTIDWSGAKLNLVYFWADWCEPCKLLSPRLEDLHQRRSAEGLRVIGVYHPSTEPKVVSAYLEHYGLHFPILRQSKRIGVLWGTTVLPTSYLIDAQGRILRRYAGSDGALMDALVRDTELVLDGKPLGPLYAPEADAEPAPAAPAEPPAQPGAGPS